MNILSECQDEAFKILRHVKHVGSSITKPPPMWKHISAGSPESRDYFGTNIVTYNALCTVCAQYILLAELGFDFFAALWFSPDFWHLLVFPAQRRARVNDALHHKIIESLKFDISSTMEALETALASLELSDSVNYAQTAREYGVDSTTLRRRHKCKQVSRHQATFELKSPHRYPRISAYFAYKEISRAWDPSYASNGP